MALGRISSKRINNYEDADENSPQAIQGRLHFEQTRDSLVESYWWRFASGRATLSASPDTPDSEYDYQFILPTDFLAMKSIYEDRHSDENLRSYALEDKMLLTNEDEMKIKYIKKVTDPTKFSPFFVEVLVLSLAKKMLPALAGQNTKLTKDIGDELRLLIPTVKAHSGQQTNTEGQYNLETWNDARYT